jgi:hypothetical protein
MSFKAKIIASIVLMLSFVLIIGAQDQNQVKKLRHSDSPNFDQKILSGKANADNYKFRDMFYSKFDMQLFEKKRSEGGDDIEGIVEEFENNLDYSLGIDFPEEKRAFLRAYQREMLQSKKTLDDRGEFSSNNSGYQEKIASYHEKYLYQVSKILGDEEFEALFQMKKSEIKGALKRAIE